MWGPRVKTKRPPVLVANSSSDAVNDDVNSKKDEVEKSGEAATQPAVITEKTIWGDRVKLKRPPVRKTQQKTGPPEPLQTGKEQDVACTAKESDTANADDKADTPKQKSIWGDRIVRKKTPVSVLLVSKEKSDAANDHSVAVSTDDKEEPFAVQKSVWGDRAKTKRPPATSSQAVLLVEEGNKDEQQKTRSGPSSIKGHGSGALPLASVTAAATNAIDKEDDTEASTLAAIEIIVEEEVPKNVMSMWGNTIKAKKPCDPTTMSSRARINQADKVKERILKAKGLSMTTKDTPAKQAQQDIAASSSTCTEGSAINNEDDAAALFFGAAIKSAEKTKVQDDNNAEDTDALFFGAAKRSPEKGMQYDDDDDDNAAALFFEADNRLSQNKAEKSHENAEALFFGANRKSPGNKVESNDDDAVALFLGGANTSPKEHSQAHNDDAAALFLGAGKTLPKISRDDESSSSSDSDSSNEQENPKSVQGIRHANERPQEPIVPASGPVQGDLQVSIASLHAKNKRSVQDGSFESGSASLPSSHDDSEAQQEKESSQLFLPVKTEECENPTNACAVNSTKTAPKNSTIKDNASNASVSSSSSSTDSSDGSTSRNTDEVKVSLAMSVAKPAPTTSKANSSTSDDDNSLSNSSSETSQDFFSASVEAFPNNTAILEGISVVERDKKLLKETIEKTIGLRREDASRNNDESFSGSLQSDSSSSTGLSSTSSGSSSSKGSSSSTSSSGSLSSSSSLSGSSSSSGSVSASSRSKDLRSACTENGDDASSLAKKALTGCSSHHDDYEDEREAILFKLALEEKMKQHKEQAEKEQLEAAMLLIAAEMKMEKESKTVKNHNDQLGSQTQSAERQVQNNDGTLKNIPAINSIDKETSPGKISTEFDEKNDSVRSESSMRRMSTDKGKDIICMEDVEIPKENDPEPKPSEENTEETMAEADDNDDNGSESEGSMESFNDEYDEELASIDREAIELSKKHVELSKREEALFRKGMVLVTLLCSLSFGLLIFFVLDPLGRGDDGAMFAKQSDSSTVEISNPVSVTQVSTTSKHSLVISNGKRLGNTQAKYSDPLIAMYIDMAVGIYDDAVIRSNGMRRHKGYLRGLFELQVSSELEAWIEHECPFVSGLNVNDLCVEMKVSSIMGVNTYAISTALFKEVFESATSSCCFELNFLDLEPDLPISFLTQQGESGDFVCGVPIFASPEVQMSPPPTETTNSTTTFPSVTSTPPSEASLSLHPTSLPTASDFTTTAVPTVSITSTPTLTAFNETEEKSEDTLSPHNTSSTFPPTLTNETINPTVETSDVLV